jgi:hypothetical protein
MAYALKPTANPISKSLFHKWAPILRKFKTTPMTEIEIRFGRKAPSGFDTNVGQDTFFKVLRALEKYEAWESKSQQNMTMYYFDGNKRLSVNEDTDEQFGQIKKRLVVDDFELTDAPLDVRLGVSSEVPFEYDGEETSTEQKTKKRWSFIRKNLSIDMSIVKGNPEDQDDDQDLTYQIEMEIVDPSILESDVDIFNIFYKVFDIISCV